jgi:hypothetical protein
MANEVSCRATAYDFSRPPASRALFPDIELATMPLTAEGAADPVGEARVRSAIAQLHARVLGVSVAADGPEVEIAYRLFLDTMRDGRAALAAGTEHPWLMWSCQARVDPDTHAELPMDERIDQDPHYAVRAWMAVVTYLLSDHRFLHD